MMHRNARSPIAPRGCSSSLAAFFCVNAVLAEFIGVKIFALEDTLGIAPFEWNLFGQTGSLSFTAGTLLWPVVFILTDVVNEFFGRRGVRMISWLAVVLIVYGFVFAFAAIALAPADGGSRPRNRRACPTTRRRSRRCSARACGRSAARWSPS